ncbi:general substrate transporter [Cordyceps fumosorosea ARSEF 2679]|uniref:General substrate transporter n=1 Tax=Cordyceps fumosorosea (strain ARSEF 2679) TaxID=1081104 RepID=A0A162JHM7_CORFA|nr:general substrate transporter [Cordyceps fumosorosea ARSEF 2679]OAA69122.1 general substrate transporter [Cordyceps fumosorosea ARSEF 2679]
MGFFNKKWSATEPDDVARTPAQEPAANEKRTEIERSSEEDFGATKQAGVRKVEAAAEAWSKWDLVAAYGLIWLYYFATSTAEVVTRTLNPFVTSSFNKHSTSAAVNILASIIGGLTKLPLAKILDTWGRPQGLALMLLIWCLGYIITACARTIETYAAALVFSAVGAQGVSYCVTVFIADTSSLKNRALMLAFATSPYVITTPISGFVAKRIVKDAGWRWGFGLWAIVMPVIVLPLCFVFLWNQRKAKRQGLLESRGTKITARSVYNYLVEVDTVGLLLLAAGWALFLLPFSLYSYQPQRWRAPIIICFLIFGALLLVAFCVWEKLFAPVTFIPYRLLVDRTVFFGGLMFFFFFANSAIWGSYFTSMLQVVWDMGVDQTTWIRSIYRIGSCLASIFLGILMRFTGRFKWVASLYGLPLMLLGVGLLIKFRQANDNIGYVIMTQIFIAFAGGPIVVAGEMAMMAPSDHQHVAVVIAILDLFASIGSAIGSTISGAIWTGTFKNELTKRLPSDAPVNAIYASLVKQLSYAKGTPIRTGIADAYSASQQYMLATSVCLLAVAWGCVWLWRDINIHTKKQVKGNVV